MNSTGGIMKNKTVSKVFTKEYLKMCVVYGRQTGRFTWLERPIEHFTSVSAFNTWNSEHSGECACRVDANGYEIISINGSVIKAHHVAFIVIDGVKPDVVDHINGIRNDNRWCNIRTASMAENSKNCKLRSDNKSGVPGVFFRKEQNKWRAKISHKGKRISLGQFATKEEAIQARIEAEKKYGYHENHGRLK